jgi:hypothetical protein
MRLFSLFSLLLVFRVDSGIELVAQIRSFPYTESFDSVVVPALPTGWSTSTARLGSGDFVTTVSSPHSSPSAVIATNSTISQFLVTPRLDFSGRFPDKIEYWTSRSSTHTSGVLVEASVDNGLTFPIVVSDTLKNPGNTSYHLIELDLPQSLIDQDRVRFRWRVIGGSGGTSGTFRIDDVVVTVKTAIDLAIGSIGVSPASPAFTDSLSFSIHIVNRGTQTASGYFIELFDDANDDSVGQASERLQSLSPPPVNSGDSLLLELKSNGFSPGDHQVLCEVSIAGDENPTNNKGIVNFFVGALPHLVVINEIMSAPSGGEPEWIEVFNTSRMSINLKNWKISNRISSSKYTISPTSVSLPPEGLVVITKDSLALRAFHPSIPGLLLMNSSLPNALFRNDSDAVMLYDSRDFVIDSLYYRSSWGGGGGKSLERISPTDLSTEQSNWGTSLDPSGSSPGRINTLTKKEYDLAVSYISASPSFPTTNSVIIVTVEVLNLGLQPAFSYSVDFFEDTNGDSLGQPGEQFSHITTTPTLEAGDSALFSAQAPISTLGDHRYLVTIEYPLDEETLNNKRGIIVAVGLPPRSVVINEIQYAPSGGEPEWVEIFNTTATAVNLRGWRLSNRISSAKYALTDSDVVLSARGLVVVTKDSLAFQSFHPSIPGLLLTSPSLPTSLFRNDSDAVALYDQRGAVIDSLYYRSSWGGGGGKSLERISPTGPSTERSNWGTTLDPSGGSPGRVNTLTRKEKDLAVRSLKAAPIRPTVNEAVTLTLTVENIGTDPAFDYSVSFFEDTNNDSLGQPEELIVRLTSTPVLQPGDSASFSAQIAKVSLGDHRYLALVDYAADEEILNNEALLLVSAGLPARTVVINEIMYGPSGGEPEWIELYNTSAAEVNLKNWRFSNRVTSSKYGLRASDVYLPPKGFAVITRDSLAFFAFHSSIPGLLLVNGDLPIALFSNSGDAVVLFDARTNVMDSLFYAPSWGGGGGRSLERIAAEASSTDQSNWGSCLDPSGSTPGRVNTLSKKGHDLAIQSLTSLPQIAYEGATITLKATILNVGTNPALDFVVSFYEDTNGDSIGRPSELILRTSSDGSLLPEDSIAFNAQTLRASAGMHRYLVSVDYSADEDTLNNKRLLILQVGLPMRSVVINEVMYGPTGGEPEWIELYSTTNVDVDLESWRLSNRIIATKYTLSTTSVILKPFSYAVVTKDASILNFHSTHLGLLVLVPNLPTALFSNAGDAVVLYDTRGVTMDSLTYTPAWGGANGKSMERIAVDVASTDSTNWATSADIEGSTPGRQNSIATLSNDLRIVRVRTVEPLSDQKDAAMSVALLVTVQNVGMEPATGFSLKFYHDADRDSVLLPAELIGTVASQATLQRKDTTLVPFTWTGVPSGLIRMIAVVDYKKDERLSNNTASIDVRIGSKHRALIINEIMYGPLAGQAEWIELYNPNSFPVDMTDWTLSDMKDATGKANVFSIAGSRIEIQAGGYAVLSSDSTILSQFPGLQTPQEDLRVIILNRTGLSLNNEGDDVVISDLVGTVIDSVHYFPSWHNPDITDVTGISLERINTNLSSNDRRNWSSCVEKIGGTPGRQNSVFTTTTAPRTTLSVSPNPFSPDGDGFEDFTIISYQLASRIARVNVRIFDSLGRLVRTLANYDPSASTGQIIWDGLDDERRRLRMGIYIVLLEAIDSAGGTIESAKAAAVVAGRL